MAKTDMSALVQCKLGAGSVAVGKTPAPHDLSDLKQLHVSHIITLLTADENAELVRDAIMHAGFNSQWFPITENVENSETECEHFRQYVQELNELLTSGANIYLHEGDSYHRSVLILFALLHLRGIPSASAWSLVNDLTGGQARMVSKAELHWAASMGSSLR